MKKIFYITAFLLTGVLYAQSPTPLPDGAEITNNKPLVFLNALGANDGTQIKRHAGDALRFAYYANSLIFDALDDRSIWVRNSADQTKIVLHPNGNSYFNGGNLGIGTFTPLSDLHVQRSSVNMSYSPYGAVVGIFEKSGNATVSIITDDASKSSLYFGSASDQQTGRIQVKHDLETLALGTKGADRLTIDNSGKVGIGTPAPSDLLHVYDPLNNSAVKIETAKTNGVARIILKNDSKSWDIRTASDDHFYLVDNETVTIPFRVEAGAPSKTLHLKSTGDVGIGTTDTFGYKLAVNGKIGTKEVNVEVSSDWPDFVFNKNYPLPTLEEVETHIKTKGHLKDIPSEAEVKANGINLGEMDAKLLQKIEELTLYTIAQDKNLKAQQEFMEAQQKQLQLLLQQNEKLVKRIETLEKQ